ncbi:hypothetical protein A2U01_0116601 [Trifolium medium]|uniref:Uncharacterized protein n=1 Tax=Trifolium medium TaxID=97028 RepID=A0A392W6B6_9FABA|nr:hypothetical protein [Trifolium medium]
MEHVHISEPEDDSESIQASEVLALQRMEASETGKLQRLAYQSEPNTSF